MSKTFKPMLAASMDGSLDEIKYPVLATPKIDGIRCLIIDGVAMSRSLKPIPNQYIQSVIGKPEFNGLDGELLVGTTFQQATSGIMSEDGEPDFTFYVFDVVSTAVYQDRVGQLRVSSAGEYPRIKWLLPVPILNRGMLDCYCQECLAQGHEGVMIRDPNGPYKFGRATFKEGYLTKIKPFEDAEATIVGFEEQMHNGNEATTNELGRTERSSHKENLVGKDTLGAFIVEHPKFGQFNIGTFRGFTRKELHEIWVARDTYIGRLAKFRYQKHGTKDKPRIPTLLGIRDPRDT